MSNPQLQGLGNPLSQPEHPVCANAMDCSLCMNRCYDGGGGHVFDEDEKPCSCGKFTSVEDAKNAAKAPKIAE